MPEPRESGRRPLAILLAISLGTAPFATALAGPAEDKATARELAKEGIGAAQSGDCATAIDRLERAEALFHAPPHLQHLARCYAKTGRLVDATETWRKLTLETLPPGSPPAFKEAVAEAQAELPKLEPRLARLTIKTDAKYPDLSVDVDGKAWPSAVIGVPRIIDPGEHDVVAHATGYEKSEQKVKLDEGQSSEITLSLKAGAPAPSASAVPAASAASAVPSASATAAPTTSTPPLRAVGYAVAGVGVLAVAGGVVTGIIAKSKFDSLDKDCNYVRSGCRVPNLESRKDAITTWKTTTNVLLIGGGVLALAGVGLILLTPSQKSSGPTVSVDFSPTAQGGHVSLTGSF